MTTMATSTVCTPINIETLALFDDNVDIFAHLEMSSLSPTEDMLNLDLSAADASVVNASTAADTGVIEASGVDADVIDGTGFDTSSLEMSAEGFDQLFNSCMERMAEFASPAGGVETPVQVNTRTFLAPRAAAPIQPDECFWKKPESLHCSFCSKTLSKAVWRSHHIHHIRTSLKCRRCTHTARSSNSLRRHNEYYHGARRKRHVFFDSY